ncbi:choice-of-anchor V domain-containing protein [Polaribacter aquimarinus]|uniref:Secretion system C-terminal sorting domain-containing protein n=1 Tax=Polaribacter aquimarinus TaxID=2100726 RepID=A0A2U2JAU5_9FLAO|nr:choice-of-anchor V domain-containing protein [Polaribacter aquimarinus]PWG05444.1 hypothetical protein DIS07_09455 [Polaribacter aquimarinus]
MKKNYFFKFILLLIPVVALTLMSNAGGRQNQLSGSPGDNNQTCAQCHSGGNFGVSPTIQIDIPATGYELNKEYNVTVMGGAAPKHGFQITAESTNNNAKVGTFIADANAKTKVFNNNKSLTHTIASTSLNESSWTFKWRSPDTNVGAIKFYTAMVAANGTGSSGGDQVATTSTDSFAKSTLSISAEKRLDFDMYPNPASDDLNIQLPNISSKATVQFYDYVGRLALSKTISTSKEKVNVSTLTSGVYIVKVVSDDKIGSQKFIKK